MKVAVIGAGPAGLYAVDSLLQAVKQNALGAVAVDVYEKLPVPFGLVRYGVAPDHPEVKEVSKVLSRVFDSSSVRFVGGSEVTSITPLRSQYDAVIAAYGSSNDLYLGLDGEKDVPGVIGARELVEWYNGLPAAQGRTEEFRELLSSAQHVAVVGQGNVALDVARMLLCPPDVLSRTDIARPALDVLRQTRVERLTLVGRRGPLQAAFTTKELREMTTLEGVRIAMDYPGPEAVANMISEGLPGLRRDRAGRRKAELIKKLADAASSGAAGDGDDGVVAGHDRTFAMRFLSSPIGLVSDGDADGRVSGLKLIANELASDGKISGSVHGSESVLKADLVVRSIGYAGAPLDGLNWREGWNRLDHDGEGRLDEGLYATGWIKRGPSGIVGTNKWDADETVRALVEDVKSGVLTVSDGDMPELPEGTVDWAGAERIHAVEAERGTKVLTLDEMREIAATPQ